MKKIVSMILSLMMICLSVIVFADETSATDNITVTMNGGKENDDFKRIQRKSMGYFEKKIRKGFFGLSYCRLNFFCRNIYA